MKRIILLFILGLFLFGCIERQIPTLAENINYKNVDLVKQPEYEGISLSRDKKTANIELDPEFEKIHGFIDHNIDIISEIPLTLNSITSNKTHTNVDLNSITITSYFEEKEENRIFLSEIPTIEEKRLKQTIIIENKENYKKNVVLSLNFVIDSTKIKFSNQEIEILENEKIVFKTDNFNLDFNYTRYNSYSFTYETPTGETHNFDWKDMEGVEHAVIVSTDGKVSTIQILSTVNLEARETVVLDPSFSQPLPTDKFNVIMFTGLSSIKELVILEEGIAIMTEEAIYYIEKDGLSGIIEIPNEIKSSFYLPSSIPEIKFTGISAGEFNGNKGLFATVYPIGAIFIPKNRLKALGSTDLDLYNPPSGYYSFVAPHGRYYSFSNPYISEDLICFGVSVYPSNEIYTNNVFCYNSFSGDLVGDSPRAFKFDSSYHIWFRNEMIGSIGCAGVPFVHRNKLHVGAPCYKGISTISNIGTSATYTFSEPTQISSASGFGSAFAKSNGNLFILANGRILKFLEDGSVTYFSRAGIMSLAGDDEYLYTGAPGKIFILDNKNGELLYEISNPDILGNVYAGSVGIPIDDGFYLMEIVPPSPPLLCDIPDPDDGGEWEINSDTTLCAGGAYNFNENGIKIGNDGITLDCNGASLIGSGSGVGINIFQKQNVIIKNCNIENFTSGIYIRFSSGNTFKNNIIYNNENGITLLQNNGMNNIFENEIYGNDWAGIFLSENDNIYNNIYENKIYENGAGILLLNTSDNNSIYKNEIYENSIGVGINSNNNSINKNEICNNTGGEADIDIYLIRNTQDNSGDNTCDNLGDEGSNTVTCSINCGICPVWSTCEQNCGMNLWSINNLEYSNCTSINNEFICQQAYNPTTNRQCEWGSSMISHSCKEGPACVPHTPCVNLSDSDTWEDRIIRNDVLKQFEITESITLCTGYYEIEFPLTFMENLLTLDLNGSTINSTTRKGTILLNNKNNLNIKNGTLICEEGGIVCEGIKGKSNETNFTDINISKSLRGFNIQGNNNILKNINCLQNATYPKPGDEDSIEYSVTVCVLLIGHNNIIDNLSSFNKSHLPIWIGGLISSGSPITTTNTLINNTHIYDSDGQGIISVDHTITIKNSIVCNNSQNYSGYLMPLEGTDILLNREIEEDWEITIENVTCDDDFCTTPCSIMLPSDNVCDLIDSIEEGDTFIRYSIPGTSAFRDYYIIRNCGELPSIRPLPEETTESAIDYYIITNNLERDGTCLNINGDDVVIEGCGKEIKGTVNEDWPEPPYYLPGRSIEIKDQENILINNATFVSEIRFEGESENITIQNSNVNSRFVITDDSEILFNKTNLTLETIFPNLIEKNSKVEFRNTDIIPESVKELEIKHNSQVVFNNSEIKNTQIIYEPKHDIPTIWINNINTSAPYIHTANITSSDDSYKIIFEDVEQGENILQIFDSYLSKDNLGTEENYNIYINNSYLDRFQVWKNTYTKVENSKLGKNLVDEFGLRLTETSSNSKTIFENSTISKLTAHTQQPEDRENDFHIGGSLSILEPSNIESDKIFVRQFPITINRLSGDEENCLNVSATSHDFIDFVYTTENNIELICKYKNGSGTVNSCIVEIRTIDNSHCVD